jgi:hypothetical protein
MTTATVQNKAGGKKTLKKRKLTDVFVDEVSFVDYPAVPGARFLLMKRDNISEAVQNVLEELGSLSKEEVADVVRLAKAQYDPGDLNAANGGVEPETTAEEHVQALVDMLDELPEAALDHVVALADQAGIEMDDLPSVQGGDADQYDSIPAPQAAGGGVGGGGGAGQPKLSDALSTIHDHVQQTAEMPDEVKDAMAVIHGYVSGGQSPGVATDPEEGDPGAEQDESDSDNPGDTTGKTSQNMIDSPAGKKGPTDQDGQDKGKPGDKANPKGPIASKPPKRKDQIPGTGNVPVAPPKSAVSGTPGKRRDPRVLAMMQRRKAARDEAAAAAAAEQAAQIPATAEPIAARDFWEELGEEVLKRDQAAQTSDTDRMLVALDNVLSKQEAELNRLSQLESQLTQAGCRA